MKLIVAFAGLILATNVAFAKSQLQIALENSEALIAWTGGILLSAPTVVGPWSPLPEAISPLKTPLLQRAFYRVQETYTLSVAKTGTGSGTIRTLQAGINCGTDCTETILSGQTVSLQAVPDAGSIFAGWAGPCTGNGDCQLAINEAKSVTATFTLAATLNPILNGGFEDGSTGWQQQPDQLIYAASTLGATAHGGQNVARLGYAQDNRRVARIGQQIILPKSTPLFLNFATWIYSEELCDVPYYDAITIYVAGQQVVNDERVCRSSNTDGWRRYSIDLSAGAGQTVAIVFEISSVDFMSSLLLLDDISVSNQSWE